MAREALRQANELGRIRPGALADLMAVEGSPLDSLACLERVAWIMQGGQLRQSTTQNRAAV